MAYGTPGIHTHEQWLGLVQPVGLVVAPAVLTKLLLFPNQKTAELSLRQRQLKSLLDATANDPAHEAMRQSLEVIGDRYHQFRSELMVRNNEGLASTYNRFHDPSETSPELLELRRLHGEMDQAVLQAYGWCDVPTACVFGLYYLDTEDDAQLPDELQERIDSGDLFFWDAGDALDFQGQLQAYGAISGRRKLPWRTAGPMPCATTCSLGCWR